MVLKLLQFIKYDIWRIRAGSLPKAKGILVRSIRIFVVSIREFITDKCALRASALTFFSLLSIVPVFAMAFGLAKGFGLDQTLKERVLENMEGQQEVIMRVIEFSENLLQNTKGGVVAGFGLIFLFWTVIKLLDHIETSFNDIWGIHKKRTWGRKFADYLSLMLVCPVFFVIASSMTVFITSQVASATEQISILSMIGPVIFTLLKVLPYAVFWALLSYLYMFLPNTKVPFPSALLGGIIAGTAYQITQWGYIHFQIGAAKAGAVYGSFAALPLFLMWLQISWLIVLYGAELAFAHQNEKTFEFEPDCLGASPRLKKLFALRITQYCVELFCKGQEACSAVDIASKLDMPIRLTRDILQQLTAAGVLAPIQSEEERVVLYQPSRDPKEISVQFVIDQLEANGVEDLPVLDSPELEQLKRSLSAFSDTLDKLPENILLKDVHRVDKIPDSF